VNLDVELIKARLRAPVVSARGSVDVRELLLIRLEAGDGFVGVGEAAPLESYDGVSVADARAALEDCREVLAGSDGHEPARLLAACADVAVLPQAIAAIDMALWDLAGRRAGLPVWELLGARVAEPVAVNATIAAADRAGAAARASEAARAGFTALKLKVGLGDDAGRVAAVRAAAGRRMAIRLDANGAWSVPEATAALRALAPAGIELCEEPVAGLTANAEVAVATDVPLALDESSALPGALDTRWCDSVCLKISRCGGISGLLDAARRARDAGYRVYVASTFDGPLGIAAALHAAAALRPDRPCGLATLDIFAGREDPLPARDGRIGLPGGAGLGEGLITWYLRPAQ
jgi:o-succinylbenzoate synthase